MAKRTNHTRGARLFLPTILAVLLALAGAAVTAIPAAADEVPVTNIEVTFRANEGGDPPALGDALTGADTINRLSVVRVEATFNLPDTAKGGDIFTISLPPQLNGYREPFDIASGATTVATCEPTPAAGAVSGFRCTLTDAVDTVDKLEEVLHLFRCPSGRECRCG